MVLQWNKIFLNLEKTVNLLLSENVFFKTLFGLKKSAEMSRDFFPLLHGSSWLVKLTTFFTKWAFNDFRCTRTKKTFIVKKSWTQAASSRFGGLCKEQTTSIATWSSSEAIGTYWKELFSRGDEEQDLQANIQTNFEWFCACARYVNFCCTRKNTRFGQLLVLTSVYKRTPWVWDLL